MSGHKKTRQKCASSFGKELSEAGVDGINIGVQVQTFKFHEQKLAIIPPHKFATVPTPGKHASA
jgi:hypothetical protein